MEEVVVEVAGEGREVEEENKWKVVGKNMAERRGRLMIIPRIRMFPRVELIVSLLRFAM